MDVLPREPGDGGSWRRKSPDREDSRYPPRRVEEEPRRGGAYRPPVARSDDGPGNWRSEDR